MWVLSLVKFAGIQVQTSEMHEYRHKPLEYQSKVKKQVLSMVTANNLDLCDTDQL